MNRSLFLPLAFRTKSGFCSRFEYAKRSDSIVGQTARKTRENRTKMTVWKNISKKKTKNQRKRLKNPLTSSERCGNIQSQLNNSPKARGACMGFF